MIDYYDVVAVGDELAGAVAAALLARRGRRVLVLCSAPVEHDRVGPFLVPRAPLALAGLESFAVERVMTALGLGPHLRRRLTANRPAYQVLLPGHRIDVGEDFGRELARELPSETQDVDAFLAGASTVGAALDALASRLDVLPPDGFFARRAAHRLAADLAPPPTLRPDGLGRLCFELPARFASDVDAVTPLALARLGSIFRRGTHRLPGGRETLRALVLDRIKAHGGEVRHDLAVRGLGVRRGRVTGVAVGDRDDTVGCDTAIAALPATSLVTLLPVEPPRRLRASATVVPSRWRYRLHLVAPLEALPDPLGPLAFVVRDPSRPLGLANALALHVGEAQGGHAVITVEALVDDPSETGLLPVRAAMRAALDDVLPFVDRHLRLEWSPHDGAPPEGLDAFAPEAVAPDPVWLVPGPLDMGFAGLGHATGMGNLYLASRQNLGALGLEGEMITAWAVAALVEAKHKRRTAERSLIATG